MSVEPDRGSSHVSSPGRGRYRLGVVLVVAVVGLVSGWMLGSTTGSGGSLTAESDQAVPNSTSSIPVTTTTSSSTTTSGVAATAPTEFPPLRGRVEPLVGAAELSGPVALATTGQTDSENLWVLQAGGRLVQRVDVPIRPGGFEHQILIVGDHILFSTSGGTYRLGVDLSEPAEQVAGESFLIPGSTGEMAWIVGGFDLQWFAPFHGRTGELGAQTDIDEDFGWPFAGHGDGVLFHPYDTETHGQVAYWPAGGKPEPFDLGVSTESNLSQISGGLAVLISPGPSVEIIDVETLEKVISHDIESEEQPHVVSACLSPDAQHVLVSSSTSSPVVIEVSTVEVVGQIQNQDVVRVVGWSSSDQLLYVTETQQRTELRILDLETSSTFSIARLAALGDWRIATQGPSC